MKNTNKIFAIIIALALVLVTALPSVVIAGETKVEFVEGEEITIKLYDGMYISNLTEKEAVCLDYLYNMYRLIPTRSDKPEYSSKVQNSSMKALFYYKKESENEFSIHFADNVGQEDNIEYIPNLEVPITQEAFGENVPGKITVSFEKEKMINEISINYDVDSMPFNSTNTVGELLSWVWANSSTTEELKIFTNRNTEIYKYNDKSLEVLTSNNDEDELGTEDEYAIMFGVEPSSNNYIYTSSLTNLEWYSNKPITELNQFVVKVNGVVRDDIIVSYSSTWNCAMLYVPIGKPAEETSTANKGDLDRNGVVDANDASVALELFKSQNATAEDVRIGDMDENNLIDANDASLILEYYKTHQ